MFQFLHELSQRLVVGRSTFLNLRPDDVIDGVDREACCPHCRKYASASREVFSFIPPEFHDNCPDKENCQRTADCEMVRDMVAKEHFPAEGIAALNTLYEMQQERDAHRDLRKKMKDDINNIIQTLADDAVLIGMDFSPMAGGIGPERTLSEGMTKVQALMITIYYRENGQVLCRHFSFMSHANNDHWTVRRCLLRLHSMEFMKRFKTVHYVSDGGPKHYKINQTIGFVCVQLPRKFGLTALYYHFWPSHHGKWVYDGMAAVMKRQIRILSRAERRLIAGPEAYAEVASARVAKMTAESFGYVDSSEYYGFAGFEDIRTYHYFTCPDFSGGNGDRVFTIQASEYMGTEIQTFRVKPTFDIDSGLDLDELDVDEAPTKAAVKATRVAGKARLAEAKAQLANERRADFWDKIVPGVRIAATFIIDGEPKEVQGTVASMGEQQRPDTGELDACCTCDFDDGESAVIYRYKDEYRLLEPDEIEQEAPLATSRRGRTVSRPARYEK